MWPFNWHSKAQHDDQAADEDNDVMTLKLSWSSSVIVQGFSLDARIGNHTIGRAHGTYETGIAFRLTRIDVLDPYKNNGYGKIMIHTLVGAAKKQKCPEFIIEGVSDSNTDAIRLYTRLGAHPVTPRLGKGKTDYRLLI
ncbi:GNAT family N-acetyltransferase [Microvirgula aerodenitrificans]|uniref:GNAT family N-acetyltransferase n=1 Tax=Microvirgula aerodenitrificans TaxID=57480 RepID=UPI002F42B269